MPEVINFSLSSVANHVITHLYNVQEAHIPYRKNMPVLYDNSVFLSTHKDGPHTNYAPRALVYDLKKGFGSLNKYEYHEQAPSLDLPANQIISSNPVPKHPYQINLDKGVKEEGLLHLENTTYWSDYNKLIYNPRSLNTLPNYEYDSPFGSHKNIPNLKFDTFNRGVEEFQEEDIDDHLDNFRHYLEKCDLFQGINQITDIDSGWGGYSNQLLEAIIDEYFNNGISNNKYNIWIHGLMSNKRCTSTIHMVSRIKALIELSKNSTVLFPINQDVSSTMLQSYLSESLWHTSAVTSVFINSLWGLNNQNTERRSMSYIEDNLLRGFSNRKFVNEIKINKNSSSLVTDVDISNYLTATEIPTAVDESISLSIPALKTKKHRRFDYLTKNYIVDEGSKDIIQKEGITNVYNHQNINEVVEIDTFPGIIKDKFHVEFNSSTDFKEDLKTYRTIINNIRPSHEHLVSIVEEKAELIEDISDLIEEYTVGYDESDEEEDY